MRQQPVRYKKSNSTADKTILELLVHKNVKRTVVLQTSIDFLTKKMGWSLAQAKTALGLVKVSKVNPYHDATGAFTDKDHAVAPGEKLTLDHVQAASEKFGIDYPHIVMEEMEPSEVNGKKFQTYAMFDTETKEIVISPSIPHEDLEYALRHEFSHVKMESVKLDVSNWVVGNIDHLAETGPKISAYAADWWEAVKKNEASLMDAVDESLADYSVKTPKERKSIDKIWGKLYNDVNEYYQAKQ